MNAIPKALKIIQSIDKCAVDNVRKQDKAFYKTIQLIINGGGKDILSYQGDCIKDLPIWLQQLTTGLKNPQMLLGTKSVHKGQGIIGIAVKDGEITRTKLAINIDNTQGNLPIFQVKGKSSSEAGNIVGLDVFYNPNITYTSDNFVNSLTQRGTSKLSATYAEGEQTGLSLDLYYNQSLAKMSEIFKKFTDGFKLGNIKQQLSKTSSKKLNRAQKEFADFLSNKGNSTDDITKHIDLITEYASKKGKATKELITEFSDKLLKEMGHNHKIFNIRWVKDTAIGGEFNPISGDILLSKLMLNIANQDAVTILSHEMTHAEDFLKLYKKLGKERFCKLLEPVAKEKGEAVNCDWYEKASRYIDVSDFDEKAIIRDIKRKYGISNSSGLSDLQKDIYGRTTYQISEAEQSARNTESYIIGTLHAKGQFRITQHSNELAHGPFPELMLSDNSNKTYMEEINKKLKVYGKDAGKKFDELFYECLTRVSEADLKQYNRIKTLGSEQTKGLQTFCNNIESKLRLAELHKKLYSTGLEGNEIKEYDELVKHYYYSEKTLTSNTLRRMLEKLEQLD